MARLCGSFCGCLVFSIIIVAGLAAGNSVEAVLLRAVFGLVAGVLLGSAAGWIGGHVARDRVEPVETQETT